MRRALLLCLAWAMPAHAQPLSSRTPLARTITSLTSADADVRREAALALAVIGPHASVIEPLRVAMEHEAVPETRSALIRAIVQRADESDLPLLDACAEHGAPTDRRLIVSALDAIGGDAALQRLRAHLTGEGLGAAACAALVRTDERVRWLAGTLADPAARDRALSCLASAPPGEARDAALVEAGLDLAPASAASVLTALAGSARVTPAAIAMAESALARGDASLVSPALALLARHAPERVSVERWRDLVSERDDRASSALRALLVLDAAAADAFLEHARSGDADTAQRTLGVLLEREDGSDTARIAAFADVAAVRAAVLDALTWREGGAGILASLPRASDVDLALALTRPTGDARSSLMSREPSIVLRAIAGAIDASDCRFDARDDTDARLRSAACLALVSLGESEAARALETEREPSVVSWLALAARDRSITPASLDALLDAETTRLAAMSLAVRAIGDAAGRERRALEARVVRGASDPDDAVRAAAVHALSAIDGDRHRASLFRALDDPSAHVRLAAARALSIGIDQAHVRVVGRARVETDAGVLYALRGEPIALAAAPLVVRVVEHDPESPAASSVTIFLADGRAFSLCPIDGNVVVRGVPDALSVAELH